MAQAGLPMRALEAEYMLMDTILMDARNKFNSWHGTIKPSNIDQPSAHTHIHSCRPPVYSYSKKNSVRLK